ncbi:MAG: aminotransferase class IV family protein [Verrucomicrobia bacterium]|nr:aminotransferase class IV family protein [Verrucomicrobiota bacterium]
MPIDTKVMLNGKLRSDHAATISPLHEGFLYGHGLFETIKVVARRPVFLAAHHARLTASAGALELPYAVPLEVLRERIRDVLNANDLTQGCVKVVLFNQGDTTGELIATRALAYSPETYARGFRLQTRRTDRRLNSLSAHKTLNYLENIRARRAALAAGCDEMLFIDDTGQAIEGAGTNLFIVRGGVAFTPPLARGPLPGIARAQVLGLLGPDRAREADIDVAQLHAADEIFVTNALMGVMPVSRIDDQIYDLARNPFTRALLDAYRAREQPNLSPSP